MGQKGPTPSSQGSVEGRKAGRSDSDQAQKEKYRPGEEEVDQGVFKTDGRTNAQQSKAQVHMDIYSKRNAYANLTWVKDYFDEEGYDLSKKPKAVDEVKAKVDVSPSTPNPRRPSDSAISAVAAENVPSSVINEGYSMAGR